VPASLIQAVEREGIRLGVSVDGETRYSSADIRTVRAALRLLEFGLPVGELLALARETNDAMVRLAERAVELFDAHVREPIRDTAATEEEAAAQLVEAFDTLLPAVTDLVATHFRRVLLAAAEERLS
jgi:DNA-binding transcriptional MerR regulator